MGMIRDRIKNAYNAFMGRDPTFNNRQYYPSFGSRPDRFSRRLQYEKNIVSSIYARIAVDCAAINVNHVRVDENDKYEETLDTNLNEVLTISANIDQIGRAFIQDAVESMLGEGAVALVPIETTKGDPRDTDSYDVCNARVGKIVQWYPEHVRVEVYNERTGRKEEIMVGKKYTPIIENPFYSIMNEPNSTLQRLIRTLNQLDQFNAYNSAGKMDLIIQLPYVIKSETKQRQAEERRKSIETQLTGSQYGVAYIDGTERVVQLNRSVENNLWNQVKDLKEELFNQMGLSKAIFDGTADEATLLNYHNRTIEPIMTRITEECERKWISRTGYAQRQRIRFFKDPFKLVPVSQLAEIADKFTRNCIMTSNEIRSVIGMKPSKEPNADKLVNSNLNQPEEKERPGNDNIKSDTNFKMNKK